MASTVPWALSHTQTAVEGAATVAFALVRRDRGRAQAPVGICVVAGLAAFGGGTVRDILLDRRPLFWVQHAGWVWALLALCIGAMLFMPRTPSRSDRTRHAMARRAGPGFVHRRGHADRDRCRHAGCRRRDLGRRHRGIRWRAARRRLQRDPARVQRPSALRHLLVRRRLGDGAGACGRPAPVGRPARRSRHRDRAACCRRGDGHTGITGTRSSPSRRP